MNKTCRDCGFYKDSSKFIKNKLSKGGIDSLCIDCNKERVKLWRKNNPEKRKLQQQRESGKDYNHKKHLKATYGLSRDEYLKLFDDQKGCCAICGRHQLEFKKRLSVDHNHTTNTIRGLLCSHCNSVLGYAKDSIDILNTSIKYLEKHNGI